MTCHRPAVSATIQNIQMVDLKNQYLKIKPAIDAAIQACINTSNFIKGPQVGVFEQRFGQYLRVGNVIACANGTDALQIAMMALDLQPGDEVIVPAFTYVATAEVVALLRLKPVLVDVDPHTFTLDPAALEEAISSRTKLVVPVHLFGQCADMERITAICAGRELAIVEDAAQAIGSTYTYLSGVSLSAGAMSDLGTTSFFPSKNLGCFGDGGAVYTNDDQLAKRARMIANHGQAQQYQHELVGINSRLDSIQAAILTEKLVHLADYTRARQRVADTYDATLGRIDGLEIPRRTGQSTHVFHQYTLKVPTTERDNLRTYLQQHGIPSMVYYPSPLHHQKAYAAIGRVAGDLPITQDLCKRVLSLPIHTELTDEQLGYITDTVSRYFS